MVSQSRTMPPSGPLPGLRERPRPLRAARALPPVQSLPQLLAVVLLTSVVVLVWGLQGDPGPSGGGPAAVTLRGDVTQAAPTAEVAGPQGVRSAIQGPAAIAGDTAATVDLPRLRPNALPRPPERADPIQPSGFIRFIAQPGDTIYDVSIVYGVPIDEILRFNPALGDGAQISVGQRIFVPAD